jgi:cell division protein FtsQ
MHVASSLMLAGLLVGVVATSLWALTRLPTFALAGITVLGDVEHNNAVTLRANVVTRLSGNFFTADQRPGASRLSGCALGAQRQCGT